MLDPFAAASLHRSNNGRRPKGPRQVNDRADKCGSLCACRSVGQAQRQTVLDPAGAGADCGQFQAVIVQQGTQLTRIDGFRSGWEHLNGIEAKFLSLAACFRQIVPEDERASPGLMDETDGNGGPDHWLFPTNNGFRWRS